MKLLLAATFALLISVVSIFAQGSLTPPGSPAPLFKTLQEIEPRTNLQATPAPAGVDTSNANYHFIINQPGSYYLSANLSVTKSNGIQINAEGVTLDLNGFQVSRGSGSGGNGIEIVGTAHRSAVRNGSIKGFSNGVESLLGVSYARGCVFRDIGVTGCTSNGLHAGDGSVVESCRAHDNTGFGIVMQSGSLSNCAANNNTGIGIQLGPGSVVTNCTANNGGDSGFSVGSGATLTNCTAKSNSSDGFSTSSDVTVKNCSASFNLGSGFSIFFNSTVIGCVADNNSQHGIVAQDASTVSACTVSQNGFDGIRVASNCHVVDNNCNFNGQSGAFSGIFALGGHDRIEGNSVSNQDAGISTTTTGHFIVRNYAQGNTTNYNVPASGIFLGTIVGTNAAMNSANNSLVNVSL